MPRIRSIHPGLSTDEAYMAMSGYAKAVWPVLWTQCDDNGIFEWKPLVLKARLLPADNVDFETLLEELVGLNAVAQYEFDGKNYGAVRNFTRFQRPKIRKLDHPYTNAIRNFVGLNDNGVPPYAGIGRHSANPNSETIPNDGKLDMKLSPQRKEEGGSKNTPPSEESPVRQDAKLREAVEIFNAAATEVGWPMVLRMGRARNSALKARLSESSGIEGWAAAIDRAKNCSFLCGNNAKGWRADFDFLIQAKSFTKLMEGSFDDRSRNSAAPKSNADDAVLGSLARVVAKRIDDGERPPEASAPTYVTGTAIGPVLDSDLEIPPELRRY